MASGDSPSNAAIAAMGGGGGGNGQEVFNFEMGRGCGAAMARRYFIYKVLLESPLLEPHISSKAYMLNIGCNTPHWDLCYRGGQRFVGDSNSPISIVSHLKLTSVLILKEPYSIEKCATCLDTSLRF